MKVATVTMDGEEFYFASLDGEHYIGTSREPQAGEDGLIAGLIEGDGRFRPMLMHERYLRHTAEAVVIREV